MWKIILIFIAALPVACVLSILICAALGWMSDKYWRDKCPACGRKRLKLTWFLKCRPPPNVGRHVCDACGARFISWGCGLVPESDVEADPELRPWKETLDESEALSEAQAHKPR